MTDMVERASHAIWRKLQEAADVEEIARAALEAAFKVTDEDAEIFFGRGEKSGGEFVNHGWLRDFKTGMQALSDAAVKEVQNPTVDQWQTAINAADAALKGGS